MGQLDNKTAVVTGGSRGLGRAIVEALAAEGASVWAIARDEARLEQLKREVPGVQTRVGDVADPQTAARVMEHIRPDIMVLNAGARPWLGPVHEQSWEQFSRVWETDVRATFEFGKAAMTLPPGSTIIVISSGAAIGGSALSGGYAGAKRTQWFLADYLQHYSNALNLGLRFVALLPLQIIGATELGHAAASAYAAEEGLSTQAFLERQAQPLTPEIVGRGVVALLTDPAYHEGSAFGVNGRGLEPMK